MNTIIRNILAVLMLCLLSLCASAQAVVKGTVTDEAGQGIEGVVVKLTGEGRMLAYGITRADGTYELRFSTQRSEVEISFEHLSYKKEVRTIGSRTQTLDVTLTESNNTLREVTVSAPKITTRDDTLSYHLSAFAGQGDTSLEDAMKKLPGISVGGGGGIKYQGKDISKFTIEGMDLLGGRYTLATKNLPLVNVQDVQVISNYKEAKMDKDRYSDDVAINIKLKEKAKFKPTGTSEALMGYGDEWLYRLGVTGMMFTPSFQTIVTAKAGNDKEFALDETTDLVERYLGASSPHAMSALGSLTASTPSIANSRFMDNDDAMVSTNSMKKLSEDATLKANLNYAYSRTSYDYATQARYFTGEDEVVVDEQIAPVSRTHRPSMELEYRLNTDDRYLSDKLSVQAYFTDKSLWTLQNLDVIDQRQSTRWMDAKNDFSWRIKMGRRTWNLSSKLQYTMAPTARLRVTDTSGRYDALQQAQSHSLQATESMSTTFRLRRGTIFLPLSVGYLFDNIETELRRERNNVDGHRVQASFSPRWEYTSADRRINLLAQLGGRWLLVDAQNWVGRKKNHLSRLYLDPTLNLNYTLNPYSSLHWNNSLSHSVGDVLGLLTAPVQQTYRTQSVRSGILSQGRTLSSTLRYEFKQPVSLWFVNARMSYMNMKRNLLSAQSVTADDIGLANIASDNTSHNLATSLSVTKTIAPLNTKLTLEGSYLWTRSKLVQQQMPLTYDGRTLSLTPSVNARPWQWMELDYRGSLSKTTTEYAGTDVSRRSRSHRVKLSLYPTRRWQFSGTFNAVSQQLTDDQYKHMRLFDAAAEYKLKSVKLSLQLNNLLGQHRYAYTVFTGIDSYSYDYRLRGREVMLSMLFTR